MTDIRLGLKENRYPFIILVLINAFVGGMVGMERSILPQMAQETFHLAARSAILSFIVVFGISKALANYYTGSYSNKYGRKPILVLGWIIGLPVPFILMFATHWYWVILANVLLGIHQGLAWSSTVIMKIDLVGKKQRGLAMGINEFAGYLAVGIVAFLTGWIANTYGLRPYPFYLGIGMAVLGLGMSIFLVKDTLAHAHLESKKHATPLLKKIFWATTWKNKNLGSVTQAGMVNNLNDGMIWGILPLLLSARSFSLERIGIITAIYPAVWGIGQLFTGRWADRYSKKRILVMGMLLQGLSLFLFIRAQNLLQFIGISAMLGWGTAMVYPTFLAAIADYTHPVDRPKSIGIFRLWRDLGYAFGAVLTGIIADWMNLNFAIGSIGVITILSSFIISYRMDDGPH